MRGIGSETRLLSECDIELGKSGVQHRGEAPEFAAGFSVADQALTIHRVAADRLNVLGLAAKTAGTGRAPNVAQVAGFSAGIVQTDQEAITAALAARSSKSALAAVLAGRASELTSDAERIALGNLALGNRNLTLSARSVAEGIGDFASDPSAFALATATANSKLASKIVTGVTVSNPTSAGAIFDAAVINTNPALQSLRKGIASLVKSVGAVASIEEVEKVAYSVGLQIRTTGSPVKLSSASAIGKSLAKAIISKPLGTGFPTDPNRAENKRDELGEVAAYLLGGIIGWPQLTANNAAKTVLSLIKAVVSGSKSKKTGTPSLSEVAADIAGSVAFTVAQSSLDAAIKASIEALLLDTKMKNAASIAGGANKMVVFSAMQDAFTGVNTGRFEDGTNVGNGSISDPVTDIRNF